MDCRQRTLAIGLATLGILQGLFRYFQVTLGPKTLFVDAREVWRPLAQRVLAGAPLYVGQATDNKPPVFELLNLAIAATGHYVLIFTVFIGLANAATAILIWQLLTRYGRGRAGLLSAVVLMGVLSFIGGLYINVRSLALPFVLFAFLTRRPSRAGVSLAIAGLITQYSMLATPVVLVLQFQEGAEWREAIARWEAFAITGVGTAAVAFATVGVIFGQASLVGAIVWSAGYGTGQSYVFAEQAHSPYWTPVLYVADFVRLFVHLPYVFVPAALGFYKAARALRRGVWTVEVLLAAGAACLGLSLLVRSFWLYWILPLPFVVGLAVLAVEDFIKGGFSASLKQVVRDSELNYQ